MILNSGQRAQQIDSLRALAVFAVIFSHTISDADTIGDFSLREFGAYGVYLFFVISGFLITGQLIKTKNLREENHSGLRVPLQRFFAKRALRLLPTCYLALCAAWIVDLRTIRVEFPWHALQLSNVYFGLDQAAELASPVRHLWSLSMEWQFYLVWPFVVLLCSPRWLSAVTVGLIAFSFASWLEVLPLPEPVVNSSIPASLDSLGFGALLAIALDRGWPLDRLARYLWWTGLAVIMMTLPLMTDHTELGWALAPYAHEMMNLFFALLVYRCSLGIGGRVGRFLDLRFLQYSGLISYGIYLYHPYIVSAYEGLVPRWGGSMPIDHGWRLTIAVLFLSWTAAHFSWRWLEQPVNRLRRYVS